MLAYSTCSLDPRENQEIVDGFVKRDSQWKKVVFEEVTLPSFSNVHVTQAHGTKGYVALLQRMIHAIGILPMLVNAIDAWQT